MLSIDGVLVSPDDVGDMVNSDVLSMGSSLATQGYALLRQVINRDVVLRARSHVLDHLAQVDEIERPSEDAVFSGRSERVALHPDLGVFWKAVSEAASLREAVHAKALAAVMDTHFAAPCRPFDFVWLRAMAPGRASPLHVDHPYMNRGTLRFVSCWIPLGDIRRASGGLYVVETSHQIASLREQFEGLDVDRSDDARSRPPVGHITRHALDFARNHDRRLLSTDYDAGDVLVFDPFLAHASFDNNDELRRVRLSCDTRWQPADAPYDERFQGSNPSAHRGLGYGCLASARPLTETLQRR